MFALGLGIILGSIYMFAKLYELYTNRYFNTKVLFIVICIVGVALLVAQINPPSDWDLYRHYEEIDNMRSNGSEYVWHSSRYVNYICATLLFYIASLTPWNGTLVFVSIFIELYIIETIIKFYRERGLSAQTASICFFLFLSLSNIVLAISGIRNVLASILLGYAIWNLHCRKKMKILSVVLGFAAITIHPAAGLVLILYIVSYLPILPIAGGVALFCLPLLTNYSDRYMNTNNIFLSSSAGLFELYVEERAGLDIRVTVVSATLIVMSIMIIIYKIYKLNDKTRYTRFALIYSLGTLGMISQGLIYSRMLYGLGNIYVVLLATGGKIFGTNKNYRKMIYIYKIFCLIYFIGMLMFQGYELTLAILRSMS